MVYSDDELLQLFNDGTERGCNGVYEKFGLNLYHYVLRMGVGKNDAMKITTETFIQLFKRKILFGRLLNIYAYLLTTARNNTIGLLDQQIRMEQIPAELPAANSEDDQTAFNEEVTQETIKAVLDEIDKLPNQCRTIFILAFLHGKSNSEISTQLNIQEKTVRNQKHKARQHLRMTIPLRNWLKSRMPVLVA